MKSRTNLAIILGGLLGWPLFVALVLALYFWETGREKAALAPPPGVDTVVAFSKAMPKPTHLAVYQKDGREFVVWSGEISGILGLPSGPSQYIFDDQGKLTDWTPESGEASSVDQFLNASEYVRDISLDQAVVSFPETDAP